MLPSNDACDADFALDQCDNENDESTAFPKETFAEPKRVTKSAATLSGSRVRAGQQAAMIWLCSWRRRWPARTYGFHGDSNRHEDQSDADPVREEGILGRVRRIAEPILHARSNRFLPAHPPGSLRRKSQSLQFRTYAEVVREEVQIGMGRPPSFVCWLAQGTLRSLVLTSSVDTSSTRIPSPPWLADAGARPSCFSFKSCQSRYFEWCSLLAEESLCAACVPRLESVLSLFRSR